MVSLSTRTVACTSHPVTTSSFKSPGISAKGLPPSLAMPAPRHTPNLTLPVPMARTVEVGEGDLVNLEGAVAEEQARPIAGPVAREVEAGRGVGAIRGYAEGVRHADVPAPGVAARPHAHRCRTRR